MQDTKESPYCANNAVCDALRYLGDASFAVLPKDVAHQIGELKTNLLGGIRWLIEKEIEWVQQRVEGGDRLREEWRKSAHERSAHTSPTAGEAN
jgi:hypothetical protein